MVVGGIFTGASKLNVVPPVRRICFSRQATIAAATNSSSILDYHQLADGNSFPNTGGFWMSIPFPSAEVGSLSVKNRGGGGITRVCSTSCDFSYPVCTC